MFGLDEVEIVGRGVIFGKGSESASLQQSNRQVEARRTELALVIAVGNEVGDCQMFAILSAAGAGGDPVDQCISPAAALVVRPAPSPMQETTRPCAMFDIPSSFCASHDREPIVPGAKTNL